MASAGARCESKFNNLGRSIGVVDIFSLVLYVRYTAMKGDHEKKTNRDEEMAS